MRICSSQHGAEEALLVDGCMLAGIELLVIDGVVPSNKGGPYVSHARFKGMLQYLRNNVLKLR